MPQFVPSTRAEHVLRRGRIIGVEETPDAMVRRVTDALAEQEAVFSDRRACAQFAEAFGAALVAKEIVMSTPVMTNAGRYPDRPLTACTVPTVDFDPVRARQLKDEIIRLHEQGMGTGFNLDETDDPVATLRFLNDVAVESAEGGREDRPVGNMAILSVRHPKINEFIHAKVNAASDGTDWKFNISIDLDRGFLEAMERGEVIELRDGRRADARQLFETLCSAAATCADPGIVFLDRMNARNPLPGMGAYTTTAPCAEVGLIAGETCQFGYLNIRKFVATNKFGQAAIDTPKLADATRLLTRALDNSLEISQRTLAGPRARHVLMQKRKIGIGLCGLADALSVAGLPYDSEAARVLMTDILSFINFTSKEESVRLGEQRGPFGAMSTSVIGNRHRETPGHIERLYGQLESGTVPAAAWRQLSQHVAATGMLRHVSTIALPPTGRSALVIDASTGIEPHFDTFSANEDVRAALERVVRNEYRESIYADPSTHSQTVQNILASASEISPAGHIAMAAALQQYTDEAISKTINLPIGATADEVRDVYCAGYKANLSGVTVYVDSSREAQPKELQQVTTQGEA
ncbi:ribonucleotide reductase N-terminal alpha domain-containing protein [Nocardia wallacei]|uniref:ribonucleotide reductase N-terminal alpha domain-containing protein n=1 Tax=Nocardia wallacei TaxID=480035 RepID=UPI0024555A70|nr:ribonucleotide reductase N-terminal alpha domain-containing protein [Nocardia wallacei]